jgi:hypothetical protein
VVPVCTLPNFLVGARGFEPPTSRSRTERSTRLSHAPTSRWIIVKRGRTVKRVIISVLVSSLPLRLFASALPSLRFWCFIAKNAIRVINGSRNYSSLITQIQEPL